MEIGHRDTHLRGGQFSRYDLSIPKIMIRQLGVANWSVLTFGSEDRNDSKLMRNEDFCLE